MLKGLASVWKPSNKKRMTRKEMKDLVSLAILDSKNDGKNTKQ